jgi:hypothetical protein
LQVLTVTGWGVVTVYADVTAGRAAMRPSIATLSKGRFELITLGLLYQKNEKL